MPHNVLAAGDVTENWERCGLSPCVCENLH
jgi:hypothetical protein